MKSKQPIKNGVELPRVNTAYARVWDVADEISIKKGRPAERSEVLKACKKNKKINDGTARNQYSQWALFHDVEGFLNNKKQPNTDRFKTTID
ncbi:MAG: hypothetical protein CMI54_05645 [Parcubacteria group bacterium]|jgi:ribosomal protein L1|nr:hypothetical protein [Parcubacteria group bacterium]|tara:strand:+ start:9424 stop:9699 length:276 start_codon:yes stop_codon:yes gene_type:complete